MPLSRRTWIIIIAAAAALTLVAGITVGAAAAARADAAETAKLCTAALHEGATARKAAQLRAENADRALSAVKSVELPGGEGWKSTSYLGQTAAGTANGNRLTAAVTVSRDALAATRIPNSCTTREQAARITRQAAKADSAGVELDERIYQLMSDFGAFQAREHTRVAAEVEAARKAAEAAAAAAAAKKAAEEEAARKAAAEEASRKAASGSSSSGSGGPAPSKPSGGGSVGGQLGGGVGSGGGGCQTSNGVGGTTRC